jgi:hypothetical protein
MRSLRPVDGSQRAGRHRVPAVFELGARASKLFLALEQSGVFPDQGPYGGGTQVVVIGHGFTHATAVYFGSRRAASFAVLDDQTIVAVSPSGSGVAAVTVTTPGGTAVIDAFYYISWPRLRDVRPPAGPIAGGNDVVLDGSGLLTVLKANFADSATFATALTDQQALVIAPPAAGPGRVPVYVTGVGGVSNQVPYIYAAAPSVLLVTPASGPIDGGTTVVLSGSGLDLAEGVTVGGTAAASFRSYSDSILVLVVPPGVPGASDIVVTTPGGTGTVVDAFTYVAETTTTVASVPDPSIVGEAVEFTAVVTGIPSADAPVGTVTFDFGDGTPAVTAPLTAATATVAHTYTESAGNPYAVTAAYSGDALFYPSTGTDTQTVEPAPTTTTVTSLPTASVAGEEVTLTARVVPLAPGAGVPTGTVTFDFGDGTPQAVLPVSGGVASVQHVFVSTAGSPFTVTASYSGDGNFLSSLATDVRSVDQAGSTTQVAISPTPSVPGQPVNVTVTVGVAAPGAGTPTGSVTFDFGDGAPQATVPLVGGVAETAHAYATTGGSPYTVTAVYGGDADFITSQGGDTRTVGPAATTVEVTSAPDPSVVGQEVAFTAAVAPVVPGAGTPTGTVTFDFGDGTTPVAAPLAAGTAAVTHAFSASAATPYTVTASYSGDPDFTSSPGTGSQTVEPADTAVVLFAAPDPAAAGQQATYVAAIVPQTPAAGTPTGSVTFDFGDGSAPETVPVTDGTATVTRDVAGAADSPYTITATYSGSADFNPSSASDVQAVVQAVSTTTLGAAPEPSAVGEAVTFMATVAADQPVAGTPSGSVTFDFGDGTGPVTVPLTGDTAEVAHTYTSGAASPYTLTATYSGDADFAASSGTFSHAVVPSETVITVVSAPEPSVTGAQVTLTATVTPMAPGAGVPTGSVTFDFGDGTELITILSAEGIATAVHAWTGTTGSPYTITAVYGGDADFTSSEGTDTQAVDPAPTLTTVTSSPQPSAVGQPVTLIARVATLAPGAGVPSGSVTFDFGDGTATVTAPVVSGAVTVTHAYANASQAPYPLTATYSGDADFAPSTGTGSHEVAVEVSTSTVDVGSSPDPSAVGDSVTFTADVTAVPPAAGLPTGTVAFDFGDGTQSSPVALVDGQASVTHTYTTTAGSPFTVTAAYSGDSDFSASTGADTQTVTPAPSTTTVVSSPDPSVSGESVILTATVAPESGATGTPGGTVTFDFGNGAGLVTAPLVNGTATAGRPYSDPGAGPYTVTATYNGDASYSGSTGSDTHTVDQAGSLLTVTSSQGPAVAGQPVTVTASVQAVPPAAGAPSGTVLLDFGDGSPGVEVALLGGVAVVTHAYTATSGSPYTITAAYAGDAAFAGAAGSTTQLVHQAATATTVTSVPDAPVVGEPATFTATVAPVHPGAGAPSGTVTFTFGDETDEVTVPVVGGAATITRAFGSTSGSPYTVVAVYSGDADFTSSIGTVAQTVVPDTTTTTTLSIPNPSVSGEPVTFTATVTPHAAGTVPVTGTVVVDFGDGTTPQAAALVDGLATLTHTYAGASGTAYAVTATYGGSTDFAPSGANGTHTVGQASTTTVVGSSPQPSVSGQPVVVTATVAPVAPGAGTPTGTVVLHFGDGTASAPLQVVDGAATTAHTYQGAAGSPFAITASYDGDGDFTASEGTGTHTVGPASTYTTVDAAPDPSVSGQPVVVTATVAPVAPGAGTPTGTVTISFGDGTDSTTVQLTDGTATITHPYGGAGGSPFTLSATYNGSTDFAASAGTHGQTVTPATTTTTVHGLPEPSVTGQPVTFTAIVAPLAPGAGTSSGTVTFDFGDGTPSVAEPVSSGAATVTHTYAGTAGGSYTVTAAYGGSSGFGDSAGVTAHTVLPAATSTAVSSSPAPSVTGQEVTLTAAVTPLAPGTGTPTGSVIFDFGDGTSPVTVPLSGTTAETTHAYRGVSGSPFAITATYSGDTRFTASTGTDSHTVIAAATSTVVTTGPDPSVTGQEVTVTAAVAPVAPGAGTPTGTVTFDFGDGTPTVTAPLAGGAASASATHAFAGVPGSPFPVSATYSGDANFTTSTGADTQTVDPASTVTAVISSPDPSSPGEPVTVTAMVSPSTPGAGTPTGTVTFAFGDGTATVDVPVSSGVAEVGHVYADESGSPYPVTATYSGDGSFTASTGSDTHTVSATAVPTATVVDSSPDPSVTGQSVSFTATVTPTVPAVGVATGTVTFSFGDGTQAVTAKLSGGSVTVNHPYTTTAGSPYAVTVSYSGDSTFSSSTGSDSQSVVAAGTSMSVVSSPDPSVVGQPVTFTATVAPAAPGAGVPGGTITFSFGDGTPTATAQLVSGTASVTHAYASAAGSYPVVAAYSGDGNFTASTGTDSQSVVGAGTSMSVVSSPDPSVVGQSVTFTATVAPAAPGAGVPGGTVTFSFGDGTPTAAVPVSGGIATTSHAYANTSGSPYAVTAAYSGDGNFTASTGTDSQSVVGAGTLTSVVSSPDPSVVGQSVTFTATVAPAAPGAGVPTGTVTFSFGDGTPTATAQLVNGTTSVTHAYASAAGSYPVVAAYSGDGNFTASTGTDSQSVVGAGTSTSVVSSPDPSVVGQPVTFTATVAPAAPGAGVPGGTVTFDFGDGTQAVTGELSGGAATARHLYANTSGSPYAVTAAYSGDGNFTASSGGDSQSVVAGGTSTSVVSSPDPSVVGQPVTFTAMVAPAAPGAGTPTGTVTFSFGDGTPTAAVPVSGGIATTSHAYANTSGSPYAVTAAYSGDGNFTASTGTDTQTVRTAPTSTSVVSSPDPSVVGQPVTFTAMVAPAAPGAGTPTGTVTFSFGDGTQATVPLAGAAAVTTHTYITRVGGPFAVTGTYNGNPNFAASTGNDTQTVQRTTTTTTLASSPDPSATGQAVTFTATVAPVAPGAGTPTGTVTFSFGDGTQTAAVAVSGGIATTSHPYTSTTGSPYTVTAAYSGDANHTASTGTDTQTLAKAATSTTVTSAPNPSVPGGKVTVTAQVAPVPPTTGTPTGTVTLLLGDRNPQTVTLVNGVATTTFNPINRGTYAVTAGYNGDLTYQASVGLNTHVVA